VLFGSPPENWWPYDDLTTFDDEPDAFLYAFAANYKAIQYMRLDAPGLSGDRVLDNVKAALATKYISMFGFPVYSSLGREADIPYPTPRDSLDGGHAVLAVGYDDHHRCPNAGEGALRIRNSWGTDWGDDGYGWLPYQYVRERLATDFWTCFKLEWVDTTLFN
jgi:C1A family cysteine protease